MIKEFDFSCELCDYVDNIVDEINNKQYHTGRFLTQEELHDIICYASRAGYKVGLNTPVSKIPEWAYNVCPHLKQQKNI